jgi:uncharacterized protein (DUF305 family)
MRQLVTAFGISALVATTALAQTGSKPTQPASSGDHSMMLMDAEFAYLMAKHHRGGIEMAKLEESRGSSAEVKGLAAKIRKGQERDLPSLSQHGNKAKNDGMVATHEKQMEKEHQATMAKLKSATGNALDEAFAAEMAKHHEKALDMIKQAHLTDAKLKQMTDKMAAEQKQELQELRKFQ